MTSWSRSSSTCSTLPLPSRHLRVDRKVLGPESSLSDKGILLQSLATELCWWLTNVPSESSLALLLTRRASERVCEVTEQSPCWQVSDTIREIESPYTVPVHRHQPLFELELTPTRSRFPTRNRPPTRTPFRTRTRTLPSYSKPKPKPKPVLSAAVLEPLQKLQRHR